MLSLNKYEGQNIRATFNYGQNLIAVFGQIRESVTNTLSSMFDNAIYNVRQEIMESEYKIPPTIFHVDESGLIDYKKGLELYDLKDIKLNDENIKSSEINGLNEQKKVFF